MRISNPDLGQRYNRVLAAATTSQLGSGLHLVAFPLLAASLTHDARIISALALAGAVPSILLALPVGAWVDRSHRGRLMAASDLVCALIIGSLAGLLILHKLGIWHLLVAAAAMGVAELVFGTSSYALLPSLVRGEHLVHANTRLAVAGQVSGGVVGPALGGIAYGVSAIVPFALNAASYVVSSLLIGSFAWGGDTKAPGDADHRARRTRADRRAELFAGLAYLKQNRGVRTTLVLSASAEFFGWLPEGTLVLFAKDELGMSNRGFGLLAGVTTLGAILGGLFAPRIVSALGLTTMITVTFLSYGLLLIPVAFLRSGVAVGAVFFLQGLPLIANDSTLASAQQRLIPSNLLGRVSAVRRIVGATVTPTSLALGGLLGHTFGLRPVWGIAGLGFVVVFALNYRGVRQLGADLATR